MTQHLSRARSAVFALASGGPGLRRRSPAAWIARWALVAAAIAIAASAGSTAWAQPTRRDQPLRTPPARKKPVLTPSPQPGAPPGRPGAPPAEGEEGAEGPKDPSKVLQAPLEIKFEPKQAYAKVKFNIDDADLPELVKAIALLTGRRFIYGGKLRQIKATVYSPQEVTVAEAFSAFLSILEMNGMTVIPHGRFLKIIESPGVVSQTTPVLGTATPVPYEDRFITRMYRLTHVDATEVSTLLGKFKSKDADITVYTPSNLLIITDTGTNIRRMLRIIEELDAGGAGDQIWLQQIHHLPAADVAAKLSELLEMGGGKAKIIAEERNNQLIIVATESDYLRLLEIIKRIDIPAETAGTAIHVLPLQHAQCDELSQTLGSILSGSGGARAPASAPTTRGAGGTSRRAPTASASQGGEGIFDGQVGVTCDPSTNSLITTSSLRDYARLREVIDRLDQARRQVFIEAVIMDVNVDHSTDLGIGYHGGTTADLGGGSETLIFGGVNAQQSALVGLPANLEALAFGVRGPDLEGTSDLTGTGLSIPGLGIVLHALAKSGDSNVLATPHILATDNIPAKISIGQNIPLQTNVGGLGNLASLAGGAAGGNAGSALGGLGGLGSLLGGGLGFQAPRQDVGIKLEITPHINDSDQVRMEIIEEFSDAGPATGALGAVPINKRTADTTVIVKDQQTVVIGGLVREAQINGETKVPVLGDIPVLGVLFRQSTKQTQKTNLLLILTPHIIRTQDDLRAIFERKMQERQEFLDRYFVFNDSLPWEPKQDYARANGLLENIRQTQLKIEERARLAAEMDPGPPKTHEPAKPIPLPSVAAPSQQGTSPRPTTTMKRPTTPRQPATRARPRLRVPGSVSTPDRYRVE